MIITLEGNIGAGKTTLAKALYADIKARGKKVVLLEEPVDAWLNFFGTNLLKQMYTDAARWSFTFHVNTLLHMTESDRRAMELARSGYIVIKERSSFSVRNLFIPQVAQYMTRAEFKIITDLCEKLEDPRISTTTTATDTVTNITLYLRTDPDICYNRIVRRGRTAETDGNDGLSLDYLQRLHEKHETAEFIGKTHVVCGNDFDTFVFFNKRTEDIIDIVKAMCVGDAGNEPSSTTVAAAKTFVDTLLKDKE